MSDNSHPCLFLKCPQHQASYFKTTLEAIRVVSCVSYSSLSTFAISAIMAKKLRHYFSPFLPFHHFTISPFIIFSPKIDGENGNEPPNYL